MFDHTDTARYMDSNNLITSIPRYMDSKIKFSCSSHWLCFQDMKSQINGKQVQKKKNIELIDHTIFGPQTSTKGEYTKRRYNHADSCIMKWETHINWYFLLSWYLLTKQNLCTPENLTNEPSIGRKPKCSGCKWINAYRISRPYCDKWLSWTVDWQHCCLGIC